MLRYDELIADLRRHHCNAKEDDTQEVCDECAYDVIIADKSRPNGITSVCVCGLMNRAADALEELQQPKWIPVTERLPEQNINQNTLDFEYVLCATTFGDVRPYKFGRRIGQGEPHFWNGAGYVDTYVTHWMPLPEPPKEE